MRVTKKQLQDKVYELNSRLNAANALLYAQELEMTQDSLCKLELQAKIDILTAQVKYHKDGEQWLNRLVYNREKLIDTAMNAINNVVVDYRSVGNGKITQASYLLALQAIADFNNAKTFVYGESVWKDTTPEGRK